MQIFLLLLYLIWPSLYCFERIDWEVYDYEPIANTPAFIYSTAHENLDKHYRQIIDNPPIIVLQKKMET